MRPEIKVISNLPDFSESLKRKDKRHQTRLKNYAEGAFILLTVVAASTASVLHKPQNKNDNLIMTIDYSSPLDSKEPEPYSIENSERSAINFQRTLALMRGNSNPNINSTPDAAIPFLWSVYLTDQNRYITVDYIKTTQEEEKSLKIVVFNGSFNKNMASEDYVKAAGDFYRAKILLSIAQRDIQWFLTHKSEIEAQIKQIKPPSSINSN